MLNSAPSVLGGLPIAIGIWMFSLCLALQLKAPASHTRVCAHISLSTWLVMWDEVSLKFTTKETYWFYYLFEEQSMQYLNSNRKAFLLLFWDLFNSLSHNTAINLEMNAWLNIKQQGSSSLKSVSVWECITQSHFEDILVKYSRLKASQQQNTCVHTALVAVICSLI